MLHVKDVNLNDNKILKNIMYWITSIINLNDNKIKWTRLIHFTFSTCNLQYEDTLLIHEQANYR